MKQGLLPLIPAGATPIDGLLSVFSEGTTVTWFLGTEPLRVHPVRDHATQRVMMAFLHVHHGVPQARLATALGVHAHTVLAAVQRYRTGGDAAFYQPTGRRGPAVLTPPVVGRCRELLAAGWARRAVAAEVGIKPCTVAKAIQQGLLPPSRPPGRALPPPSAGAPAVSTQATRAATNAGSELGMACTRVSERVLAAVGVLRGAPSQFEPACDVAAGGVLCALPALAANGLWAQLPQLGGWTRGYYDLTQVLTLLAFMALLRVKTVEALRREAPGEWGRLLGLDRIPEVRCLRAKLAQLATNPTAVAAWANALARDWLQADPDLAGTLYVDGHVRVYHGAQTPLPRRYVARQRLCLRGVTDYWVNDRQGLPFFYIDRPVDNGLLAVLREEIVPRLLRDVPNQPSAAALAANPLLPRFRLVFDRAGCSPQFLREMWQLHRIACLTYLKNPGPDWPETEFASVTVGLAAGYSVTMDLAERADAFGPRADGVSGRQFRRLKHTPHGSHQTAIVSTDYLRPMDEQAPAMFARWRQENFFHYMLHEYGLDLLAEYGAEKFPCAIPVINPAWRTLDNECRTLRGKLAQGKIALGASHLTEEDLTAARMAAWEQRQQDCLAVVRDLETALATARAARRAVPKHVPLDELPPEHRFARLPPTRKLLLDTVRMIAYRAETALAALAAPAMSHPEEARALVKALFHTTADLDPDPARQELRVVLHPLAEPRLNRTLDLVLPALNDAAFTYPGTDLRLVYTRLPPATG